MKIVEYKFTSNKATMPAFNSGFTYAYSDVINNDGTTIRIIESDTLPTQISFMSCTGLLELIDINMSHVTTAYGMFYKCSNVTSINLGEYDTPYLETTEGMFNSCTKLKTIEFGGLNTSKVHNMGGMFSDCRVLESIDFDKIDVSSNGNFGAMFRRCYKMKHFNVNNWNVFNGVNFTTTFSECNTVTTIDISNWTFNNSQEVDLNNLFYNCAKLNQVKLPIIDSPSTSLFRLFNVCPELKKIDLTNVKLDVVSSISGIFDKCDKLDTLILNYSNANAINRLLPLLPINNNTNKVIYAYFCTEVNEINKSLNDSWKISIGKANGKIKGIGKIMVNGKVIGAMFGEEFL